jgi:hypothetical protein
MAQHVPLRPPACLGFSQSAAHTCQNLVSIYDANSGHACSIAWAVFEKLAADAKDDLYYDGGQERRTFLALLAAGRVPLALLTRTVELCGPAQTGTWREIIRSAFDALKSFSFDADRSAFDLNLAAIAALTSPPALVRLFAAMLVDEAFSAAREWAARGEVDGPAWERRCVLAPLLKVSTWVSCTDVMRAVRQGDQVPGLMPEALRQVRGYPQNRCGSCPMSYLRIADVHSRP